VILSEDWIYDNILDMTEDDIEQQREKMVSDMKRAFRYESIEREGQDPEDQPQDDDMGGEEGGGEPQDLFAYDEDPSDEHSQDTDKKYYTKQDFENYGKQGGRPKDVSRYEKDDHSMGRDPLGRVERTRNEGILDKLGLSKSKSMATILSEDNLLEDKE